MTLRSLLSHNVSRVLASASISLILRCEGGALEGAVWGFDDGLLVVPTRVGYFAFKVYSRPFLFAAGLVLSSALGGRAVLLAWLPSGLGITARMTSHTKAESSRAMAICAFCRVLPRAASLRPRSCSRF